MRSHCHADRSGLSGFVCRHFLMGIEVELKDNKVMLQVCLLLARNDEINQCLLIIQVEYKYILFTNNCQKFDIEIFLKSANFCNFYIHVDISVK